MYKSIAKSTVRERLNRTYIRDWNKLDNKIFLKNLLKVYKINIKYLLYNESAT